MGRLRRRQAGNEALSPEEYLVNRKPNRRRSRSLALEGQQELIKITGHVQQAIEVQRLD